MAGQPFYLRQPISRLVLSYKKQPVVRSYVTLALSLLTVAIFGIFAIRPTAITISGLIRDLRSREQLSETLENKISALFNAQSAYADISQRISVLDQAIPKTPSLSDFSGKVEELARMRQVKIRSVSFDQFSFFGDSIQTKTGGGKKQVKEEASISLASYPFTLTVNGTYSNLYGFLGDLESLRRIVKLEGFGLTQSPTEGGVSLTLTVSGSVFSAQPIPL